MTLRSTMTENNTAVINLVTEDEVITLRYDVGETAEQLCIKICKQIGIGPAARHLFALRDLSMKFWFPPGHILTDDEKCVFDFRLRFKPKTMKKLLTMDENAYNYYYLQVRHDVLNNNVSDITYSKHKDELVGLGCSDMYRVMIEKNIPREKMESEYKKYMPNKWIRKHWIYLKKPIHKGLTVLTSSSFSGLMYIKEQYLIQFETLAPNYPCEEYEALLFRDLPNPPVKVALKVNQDGIRYFILGQSKEEGEEWDTLCVFEDLCLVTVWLDRGVEISKKTGIPSHLKFDSNQMLISFISILDGYYRLTVKWNFNICGRVLTPSLETLQKLKCHGPVGGEFSYSKLKDKRDNRPGTFILRECESSYDTFFIDVCGHDSKPRTHKIKKRGSEEYYFSASGEVYKSFRHIIASHRDPSEHTFLGECLHSSEYDKSPLLMCSPDVTTSDVAADEDIMTKVLESGPQVIPPNQLQIYELQPFPKSRSTMDLLGTMAPKTTLYRAMWRVSKGKKLEVAIKVLKEPEWQFLQLAGKWSELRSKALVRVYGVTLRPTVGMLLELVKLGPLDSYLRTVPADLIKPVDLVDASVCLATAVYYLEENGIVHGNIRCRKLLVHVHTDDVFIVKLADPGLYNYTYMDIHWLPPECYSNFESAKYNSETDVWALATTMWEIFSRGVALPIHNDIDAVKKFYTSGKRLPMPNGCPQEVYQLMTECWGEPGGMRKKPHEIMRDIKRILSDVFNARQVRSYAAVFPKLFSETDTEKTDSGILDHSPSESRNSSMITDDTTLTLDDFSDITCVLNGMSTGSQIHDSAEDLSTYLDWLAENTNNNSLRTYGRMQSIFELDAECNVILQGRLGQGFYGEVYLGMLERDNVEEAATQQVAVKKLKMKAAEQDLQDFEREIEIMKSLRHRNIVEILGVISEPEVCLVMEFIRHGSLQSYLSIHRESLTYKRLLSFSLDIASGMNYLGSKNIVHRDLAARNILVASENCVKISDFGLAQVTGKNDYYILQTNRDLPIKWYAPESLSNGRFSSRSDVWSFGVTMYEMFSFGENPNLPNITSNGMEMEGSSEFLAALERGTRLPCPPKCPQNVYVKLMLACWHINSQQRPNFAMLCSDIRNLMLEY